MPLIWCSISAHGFGHAAQIVPVLNELHRRISDLTVLLRTDVPADFFQGRLTLPWKLTAAKQDIGCVQHGPLQIDVKATWDAHRRFHKDWPTLLADEERAIRSASPDLVLSGISYLAIGAGAQAQVPCAGLCNLSWDQVLIPSMNSAESDHIQIVQDMVESYRRADLMIRPAPGLPLPAFSKVRDVAPIAAPLPQERARLRRMMGASEKERIVLIGFGGIALESLPFDRMAEMAGYRFIVSGPIPLESDSRIVSDSSIPLPFRALLSSADLIVTKPGYSTITEAVACGIPIVYVRRYNFADEQSLVEYAHRYGRAVELAAGDFTAGRWDAALEAAYRCSSPRESAPTPTGASEAADILMNYLG